MRMVGRERLDNMMRTVARSERLWAQIKKGLRVQSSIEVTLEKIMRCAYLATFCIAIWLAGVSFWLAGVSSWLAGVSSWLAGVFLLFFWLAEVSPGWLMSRPGAGVFSGWLVSLVGLLESLPGWLEFLSGWLECFRGWLQAFWLAGVSSWLAAVLF